MEQKKLLTADEVYQLFGVDLDGLNELVDSGAVQALDEDGFVHYRRDDFAKLVSDGVLTPRTSAEMFQVDSDGDIPFLKLKGDDEPISGDDDVSFLELDEDALNEQAAIEAIDSGSQPEFDFDAAFELDPSESSRQAPPDSHSDVRIAEPVSSLDASDSDVRLVSVPDAPADAPAARQRSNMPDSDSDVRLASTIKSPPESDSDVQLVRVSPTDSDIAQVPELKLANTGDSDSDVRMVTSSRLSSESDSDVQLVDLPPAIVDSPIAVEHNPLATGESDSDVQLVTTPSAGDTSPAAESDFPRTSAKSALEVSDSDIVLANPSGSAQEDDAQDLSSTDSGISLIGADDSGIRLVQEDSGIQLEGDDSGIRLDNADSGISLVGEDSGLALDSGSDSGISLGDTESGISILGSDSGISLQDEEFDPSATLAEGSSQDFTFELDSNDELDDNIHTMELSAHRPDDSGFDVSLAESEGTAELSLEDSDGEAPAYAPTVVGGGAPSKKTPRNQSLSEAFKLDEPPEVEDLEISDDLNAAVSSDLSEEFAEADEDAYEASDDDFAVSEYADDEIDELSEDDVAVPVSKARKGPREPEWGAVAVAPIVIASLMMAATLTILWGGIVTTWTGGEAPGPAGALISTLAGLIK
ncbi:hypothetical protein [Schlesneria sp. DSM 10557]|uniref:hypothetical protein n=1 Tax=Schlesneria sp. DSM 10557 TaxID=3044399 RepID=UPI0035A0630C